MQTFLPYANFARSAECLDDKRLGKQRVECLQILRTLLGISLGWENHPAVAMWRGHEFWLIEYGLAICCEWRARGNRDSVREHLLWLDPGMTHGAMPPPWIGDPAFHASHRSNLLRKNPEWYGKFGWAEGPDLPYVWPVGVGGLK